ncbi:MAG: amino acid adenylation domain-containing protein, partial [Chloroflexota bacterium]
MNRLSLTEKEKFISWNDTQQPYARESTLHDLISAQANRVPQQIAVNYETEHITYAELEQRSNQLAHYLQTLGVGVETFVGLYVYRSIDMVIGLLGILKAGATYIPIDPHFPPERIKLMVEDAQIRFLITQEALATNLTGDFVTIALDQQQKSITAQPTTPPVHQATAENLAYVIYTSGSTGKPKGVQISHRAIVNLLTSMAREPGITAEDHLLAGTTLSFDISALEIFLPLLVGAHLTVLPKETAMDGLLLAEKIAQADITIFQATPATWRLLLLAGWQGKPNLKVLVGGETVPEDLIASLLSRCSALWHMYGPTETTVWSTSCQLTSAARPITIGRPIANTETYILSKTLQPVPVDTVGDLYIGGDGVARGYYNRPTLTAERFIPNPFSGASPTIYKTGDRARYLEDGRPAAPTVSTQLRGTTVDAPVVSQMGSAW